MRQRMAGWWTAAGLALLTSVGGAMWAHAQAQTPAPAPASNGRVAIVDIQRILARSVAGAAAPEQLPKDKAGREPPPAAHKGEPRNTPPDPATNGLSPPPTPPPPP